MYAIDGRALLSGVGVRLIPAKTCLERARTPGYIEVPGRVLGTARKTATPRRFHSVNRRFRASRGQPIGRINAILGTPARVFLRSRYFNRGISFAKWISFAGGAHSDRTAGRAERKIRAERQIFVIETCAGGLRRERRRILELLSRFFDRA